MKKKESYSFKEVSTLLSQFSAGISAVDDPSPNTKDVKESIEKLKYHPFIETAYLCKRLEEKLMWLEKLSPLAVLLIKLGLEFKPQIERESIFIDRSEKLGRYALAYRITIPEEYRDLKVFIPCDKHTDAGIGMETTAACPLAQLESGLILDPSLAEAAKLVYKPLPEGKSLLCQFWNDLS